MSTIPINSFYEQMFTWYMTGRNSTINNIIWNRYLSSRGYSSAPTATPEIQSDFRSFLSTYNGLGITDQAIELGQTIPTPEDDFYNVYMSAFYGNLSNDTKKDLWNTFLVANGYTTNPPDSPTVRAQFSAFIQDHQTKDIYFESQTSQSPFEVQKRLITMNIMDSVSKYLSAMQNLVTIQSSLLIMYAKWQQEYTRMMQQIPALQKGSPGSVQISVGPTGSSNAYQFGYDNVSLTDVIRYGYTKADATPGEWVDFGSANSGMGLYSIKETVTQLPTGDRKELTVRFQRADKGWDQQQTFTIKDPTVASTSETYNMSFDAVIAKAGDTFVKTIFPSLTNFQTEMSKPYWPDVAAWLYQRTLVQDNIDFAYGNVGENNFEFVVKKNGTNITVSLYDASHPTSGAARDTQTVSISGLSSDQIKTTLGAKLSSMISTAGITPINLSPIAIAGRFLGTDASSSTADTTFDQTDLQLRGEIQSLLTQYTQNTQARRSAVTSLAQQQQSALNTAKESINQQTNIWTTILDTIDSIMKAILKQKS